MRDGVELGAAAPASAVSASAEPAGAGRPARGPDGGEPAGAEQVLIALADPIRRRILDTLAADGSATATRLAVDLPVSRQAVTKHLVMLDRAGLVSVQRRGREMRYRIQPLPLAQTVAWLARLAVKWSSS